MVPRAGEGCGCTEAPRGILYHRYRTDADGTYQILGVPAGPTRVRFLDPSRAHRGEYHHDATSYALATVVEVSGDETTTVDAALLAAG